jgi:hypothetical protein
LKLKLETAADPEAKEIRERRTTNSIWTTDNDNECIEW